MSGQPPYVYLMGNAAGSLVDVLPNSLLYLYSGDNPLVVLEGGDFFETGCVFARTAQAEDVHPERSYDIRYPYCRTALTYNMADVRADPQIGQLIPQAPFLSIQLRLVGCDTSLPVSVHAEVQPTQVRCAVAVYPGYTPTDFVVVIDAGAATLPLRLYITVTNGNDVTKQFWIGVRATRGGPASGTVVPKRGNG